MEDKGGVRYNCKLIKNTKGLESPFVVRIFGATILACVSKLNTCVIKI